MLTFRLSGFKRAEVWDSARLFASDISEAGNPFDDRKRYVGDRAEAVAVGQHLLGYGQEPRAIAEQEAHGLDQIVGTAETTNFSYYPTGLVNTIDDPLATGASTYTWDGAGRPTGRIDAQAALTWARTYDPSTGRLASQTITKTGSSPVVTPCLVRSDVRSGRQPDRQDLNGRRQPCQRHLDIFL